MFLIWVSNNNRLKCIYKDEYFFNANKCENKKDVSYSKKSIFVCKEMRFGVLFKLSIFVNI